VRRLLGRAAVALDGREVHESAKGLVLEAGQVLRVAVFTHPDQLTPEPEPGAPLEILAEAPGWIAIDKPAGIGVHPLREGERGTLLGAIAARRPEIVGVGEGGLRSGVVHRLDVDTSGVCLFATREEDWRRLRAGFAEHRARKRYRALVRGNPRDGEIELPLAIARHRPARVAIQREGRGGRSARLTRTAWRTLEVFGDAALVELRPVTGFLHQIRVTLAHLGCPVLGDRVYGDPESAAAAKRHLLHAASLEVEDVSATSADPADFRAELEARRALSAAAPRRPA
jgi:23S rRNA pseudouridine1911/1915/1917 synthase